MSENQNVGHEQDSSKGVTEILSPIEEESEDSKLEKDEIEESDTSLNDNIIVDDTDSSLILKDCTATSLSW